MTILRNKTVTKILSVLIAVVLWAYVIGVHNPPTIQTIHNIPIELLGTEDLTRRGLAIVEVNRQTVDVVVEGTRDDLIRYKDQITAMANVLGFTVGDRHSVQVNAISNSTRLEIKEVRPANIRVTIEELVSVYKPITLTFTGDEPPNTEAGRISVQPEQIEIRGPQSLVESVSYVGVSVPFSQISGAGSTFTIPISILDEEGNVVPNIGLSSETASISVTLFDTKEVPLVAEIIGEMSEDYEITTLDIPETVTLRGNRSALAPIEFIEAEPIDISEVHMTSQLPLRLILPEGVELARDSIGIHVNIEIEGILSGSFEYDSSTEIEIQGLGEGLNASINTPTVTLKIAGSEEVIDISKKEDFRLSVYLRDLIQGTHSVHVVVSHDKALYNLEITPEEVQITISTE